MAKVSIIMPVYNTGIVIHDTIKSILNQTYTDFELLLIDDGSTDETSAICDEYANEDSRIKVFHKINGGICDARNYGLSKVSGKYITFCDHDDLYNNRLLEKTIAVAEEYGCEVVKFGFQTLNERGKDMGPKHDYGFGLQLYNNVNEEFLYLINRGVFRTIWNAIYRSEVLLNNKMLFDTKYKHGGEDFEFNLNLLKYIKSIVILNDELYVHIVRGSLSTSSKFYDDILDNFLDHLTRINDVSYQLGVKNVSSNIAYFDIYISRIVSYTLYAIKMGKDIKNVKQKLNDFHDKENLKPCNVKWYKYIKYSKSSNILALCIRYILYKLYINKRFNLFYALLNLKNNSI